MIRLCTIGKKYDLKGIWVKENTKNNKQHLGSFASKEWNVFVVLVLKRSVYCIY